MNETEPEMHQIDPIRIDENTPGVQSTRKEILRQLQEPGLGARESRAVNKPRVDLVPSEWVLILAEVLGAGARKYDDHNWKRGLPMTETAASLERHLLAWKAGEDFDEDSGCPHMAHVAWNALAIEFFRRGGRLELDDRENRPVQPMRSSHIKGYQIQVLLPVDNDAAWMAHRGLASTPDAALFVVDTLARGEYAERMIRVLEVRAYDDEPEDTYLGSAIHTYFPGDLNKEPS